MANRHLKDLVGGALLELEGQRTSRPDLVLAAWQEIIPEAWQRLTEATSFEKGVVVIKVKNGALYQLLAVQPQHQLLKKLQEKAPNVAIKSFKFLIG
jgi:hypothetical protein